MFANLGKKIFGSPSDRYVKRLFPTLQRVNELEKTITEVKLEDLAKLGGDILKGQVRGRTVVKPA